MKLSIGMIVKNEEKNLRECLEAMRPILQQIDSELIIADTGSTDATVSIAKEYTENVFYFEWCDDFAAARNATIDRAKGEWYMAVDADESFEDTSPLIDFFNSGEYKKYKSATYSVRSFSSSKMDVYSDISAVRLTKLTKDTRYQDPIHEYLNAQRPVKFLPLVADHTGYIWEDPEFTKKKAERNLSLLLLQLKKNPKHPRTLLHLSQSYAINQDYDSAIFYAKKGLKHAKEEKHIVQYCFYSHLVSCYDRKKQYRKALDTINEYFQAKKETLATDLKMYHCQSKYLSILGDYKAAAIAGEKYIRIFAEYQRGHYHTQEALYSSISCVDNKAYEYMVNLLIVSYVLAYDYKTAINRAMKVSDTSVCENRELIKAFDQMNQSGDFRPLIALYDQLSEPQRDLFQKITEKGLASEKYGDIIASAVTSQDMCADYLQLLSMRCSHETGTFKTDRLLSFIGAIKEWKPMYADAVYFALKYKSGIGLLAERIDSGDLAKYLINTPHLHFADLPDTIMSLCEDRGAWEKETVKAKLLLAVLFHWALTTHRFSGESENLLFVAFAETSRHYIDAVFKAETLTEENISILPKLFRLGYHSSQVIEFLAGGEYKKSLRAIKQMLADDIQFVEIAKALKEEIQNKVEAPRQNESEFQRCAAQVLENIRLLMRREEYHQAERILDEYEKMCPDDESIAVIRKELSEKAG